MTHRLVPTAPPSPGRSAAIAPGLGWSAHLGAAGVVAVTAMMIWQLVPSPRELGTELLRDGDRRRARRQLEAALRQQPDDAGVIVPLADAYVRDGDWTRARRLLGRLDAGQQSLQVRALRAAAARQSHDLQEWLGQQEFDAEGVVTDGDLRALADGYAEAGLWAHSADTLRRLAAGRPGDVPLRLALARLEAGIGRESAALATLEELWADAPEAVQEQDFALMVALTARQDPSPRAEELWSDHRRSFGAPAAPVAEAALLAQLGRPAGTARLLAPYVSADRVVGAALEPWTGALVALGRDAEAFAALQRPLEDDTPRQRALVVLLNRAIGQGDAAQALAIGAHVAPAAMTSAQQWWLAQRAAEGGGALARAWLARTDAAAFALDPVAAAAIHARAGLRTQAARWAEAAATADLDPSRRRWLVEIELGLGRPSAATRALRALPVETGWLLADALLWWRAGAPGEGQAWLAAAPAGAAAEVDVAQALLRAAAGDRTAALALLGDAGRVAALQRHARAHGAEPALRAAAWAMHGLARDADDRGLALATLRWLCALYPQRTDLQRELARAELAAGQGRAALARLDALGPARTSADRALAREALQAAWAQGADVRSRLVADWAAAAADATAAEADRQAAARALVELGAWTEALPWLQLWARERGGGWVSLHLQALQAAGDRQAEAAFWRDRGADPALALADRVDAAHRLVALGAREDAIALAQRLAEGGPADSPAAALLVHLWGPRPGAAALAWLRAQAARSDGAPALGWWAHVLAAGGAGDVVAGLGPTAADGEALALLLTAAHRCGDRGAVAALVARRLATMASPEDVARVARACVAHRLDGEAAQAWRRLLLLAPDDGEALRALASREDTPAAGALALWERLFGLPPQRRAGAGWAERWRYATLLQAAGRTAQARAQLLAALHELERAAAPAAVRLPARGRLLAALGRDGEAAPVLAAALAAAPCDDALRADAAGAWLRAGALQRADDTARRPPGCAGARGGR